MKYYLEKMEVEKKYLIKSLPEPKLLCKGVLLNQGYLFTEPYEIRVRRFGTKYYLTVKSQGTLSRQEWSQQIPRWVFEALWPYTEGRRIEKTRYSIHFQDLILEVDEYHGNLEGLIILECEFPNEETARSFVLPIWAKNSIDITDDNTYKNKHLAEYGLPKKY